MIIYQVLVIYLLFSIKFSQGFSDLVVNNKKVNLTLFDVLKSENLTEINNKMKKSLRPSNLITKDDFNSNDKSLSDYSVDYIHIIPKPQNVNSYKNHHYPWKYNYADNIQHQQQQYVQVTTIRPYKYQNNLPIDDNIAHQNLLTFLNFTLPGVTTEKWENSIEDTPYTSIDVTHPTAFIHATSNKLFDNSVDNSYNGYGNHQPNIEYAYLTTDYPVIENNRPLKFFTSTPTPFVTSSTVANTIANYLGFNRPPPTNQLQPNEGQNPVIYLNYNSEVNKNKGEFFIFVVYELTNLLFY